MDIAFPKPTHNLYKFIYKNRLFVVDLDVGKVLEADPLIWDILQLCPQSTTDEIIDSLSVRYDLNAIHHALEQLRNFEEMGLLLGEKQIHLKQRRPRILVGELIELWKSDDPYVASGYRMASKEIVRALSKYADLFFISSNSKVEVVSDGIYTISPDKLSFHLRQNQIDGIFMPMIALDTARNTLQFPFYSNIPAIIRIGSARGHGGAQIDAILYLYAAMRPYDAFMVPTGSVKELYSQYVLDLDCFHVIPNGVNSDLFCPMDKAMAKSKIADILNRPEIIEKHIVGFFGRFQPEKGGGIFIQVAAAHPELLFLVVAPNLHAYKPQKLPSNLIYIGKQAPREMLPWYLNTFDIHCFPSMVGEETFGNAVLEAMACGVPPIVPNFDGPTEVVGDAGVIVECEKFWKEIGSFAAYVDPESLSKAITSLMKDDVL
ncbi:glycosyltransferase family 4 protein [Candidatus Poribacteria bacterium]|nr:glycosyltransferase family 4 protein [Candidatus Poribacteria bacterium]